MDWAGSCHMHRDFAHSTVGASRSARRGWFRPDHHRWTDAGLALAHLAAQVSLGVHIALFIGADPGSAARHSLASPEPHTAGAFRRDILALVCRTADNH